jgi:putative ABC transport system permease protein
MPREFVFFPEPTEVWSLIRPGRSDQRLLKAGVGVFARLKRDANLTTGADELRALVAGLDGGIRYGVRMQPVVRPLQAEFTWLAGRNLRTSLIILFAAAVSVLLISCFNVASLLLGRSVEREREMALRAALGSGRGRLVRQLLTESLLLAILSAGIGTLIAFGAVHWFGVVQPIDLPVGSTVAVNLPVLAFATALAAATAILFGFVPAWKASGVSLGLALHSGARAVPRFGKRFGVFVAAEVAFSLPLLIAAGLLIQSVQSFATVPLGFDPNRLVRIPVSVPPSLNPAEQIAFYRQLLADAEASSRSPLVSLSTAVPVRGGRGTSVLLREGQPEPTPDKAVIDVVHESVSEGYFACLGIPVRSGREFTPVDQSKAAAVAIINRQLARKYFPDQDPMGKRIKLLGDSEWVTIVGIADDEQRSTPFQEMAWLSPPIVYRPIAQRPAVSANLLLRQDSPGNLQRTLQARHPGALIGDPERVSVLVDTYLKYPRFRALLVGLFALLALVLAISGIYGVLSQLVIRRSREIGIRMALGAQRRAVVSLILREGVAMTLLGSVVGLALTWWTSRFLTSLLYGVAPLDLVTISAVLLMLIAASLLAVCIPARRAASVDPVQVLRQH